MAQEFYSLEEAAGALGITPEALDQLRKENKIPCVEEQGVPRFRVTRVQEYARTQQAGLELSASDPQLIVPEPPRRTTSSKPKSGLNVPAPDGGFNLDVQAGPPADAAPPPGTPQPSILKLKDEPLPPTVGANDFTINTDDFGVGPGKTGTSGLQSPPAPGKTGSTGMTPGAPARTGSTGMTPGAPAQTRPPTVAPPPADPSEDIFSASVDEVKLEAAPATPAPAPPPSQSDDIFSVDLDNVKLLDEPAPPAAPALKTPLPAAPPSTEEVDGDLGVPSGSDAVPLNDDFGIPPPEPVDQSGSDVMPLSEEPAPTVPSAPALEPEPLADSSDDFSISTDDFAGMSPEPPAEPPPPPAGVEPSGSAFDLTLDADAGAAPAAGAPGTMLAGDAAGDDAEIMFGDIDTSRLGDDSMIGIGEPPPDSVVGLGPPTSRKQMKPPGAGELGNLDLMPTDSIDLDAELQQAAEQSLARKGPGKSKVSPSRLTPGKTKPPGQEPELPAGSPFELSEADLEVPSSLGESNVPTSESNFGDAPALSDSSFDGPPAGASEFELTLAPEDENVDLGGVPTTKSEGSSSNRAALSGINLQAPADSGISLEGDSSESVDFELTLDDESGGPKTSRGLAGAVDSDSEFELTLDEAGGPATIPPQKRKSGLSGEQDIFETDFELPAVSGEESASQAVALEESDTDLESSDFDLAIEEVGGDDSGSQVVALEDSADGGGGGKTKAMTDASLDQSMADADFTSDEELLEPEASSEGEAEEEEEPPPVTVPAAEADWGLYPLLMMIPCVVIMFMGLLMSYELLHNMWGYHQPTKPSGLLVEGFASMFKGEGQ